MRNSVRRGMLRAKISGAHMSFIANVGNTPQVLPTAPQGRATQPAPPQEQPVIRATPPSAPSLSDGASQVAPPPSGEALLSQLREQVARGLPIDRTISVSQATNLNAAKLYAAIYNDSGT
jgi:hypothetical protein